MSIFRVEIFVVAVAAISAIQTACGNRGVEASAPGECKGFNEEHLSVLRSQGNLATARELRGLLLDCDVSKSHLDEAMHWAKIAAELGDTEDKRVYRILTEATASKK